MIHENHQARMGAGRGLLGRSVARAASSQSNQLVWFNPADAAEIKAIASQIIPDDDGPGAETAGRDLVH